MAWTKNTTRTERYVYDSDRKRPKTEEGKMAKSLPIVKEYKSIGLRLRGDVPREIIELCDILFAPMEAAAGEGDER